MPRAAKCPTYFGKQVDTWTKEARQEINSAMDPASLIDGRFQVSSPTVNTQEEILRQHLQLVQQVFDPSISTDIPGRDYEWGKDMKRHLQQSFIECNVNHVRDFRNRYIDVLLCKLDRHINQETINHIVSRARAGEGVDPNLRRNLPDYEVRARLAAITDQLSDEQMWEWIDLYLQFFSSPRSLSDSRLERDKRERQRRWVMNLPFFDDVKRAMALDVVAVLKYSTNTGQSWQERMAEQRLQQLYAQLAGEHPQVVEE